jgi:hypothetical protein
MGSEGSVLPSNGIPLVDARGVLGMAWGCPGHYCSGLAVEGLRVTRERTGSKVILVFCHPSVVGLAPEPYAF